MNTNDFYRIYDDVLDMFNNLDLTPERASWRIDDMVSQFTEGEPEDQPGHGKITSFIQLMRKLIRLNLIDMKEYNDCICSANDFADSVCDFLRTNLQNYMPMSQFLKEYPSASGFPGKSLFIASTDVWTIVDPNDTSISLVDATTFWKIGEAKFCDPFDPDFLLDNENPDYQENVAMLKMAFTAPDIGFALAMCAFCNNPRQALREMNKLPDGSRIKKVFQAYLNDFRILQLLQASSSVQFFLYGPRKDRLSELLDLLRETPLTV
jgi:hypothetical protein